MGDKLMYLLIAVMSVLQVIFDVLAFMQAREQREQAKRIESQAERIYGLETENLRLGAASRKEEQALLDVARTLSQKREDSDAELESKIEGLNQRLLTLENKQPKIAVKPIRGSFRAFRDAIERSTEPEEAE